MLRSLVALVALTLAAGVAHADSFISQTYTDARAANRLYTPYKGTELTDAQAVKVAKAASKTIVRNRNTAVRLDVIRAMHMATEKTPTARARFTHALTQISRGTSAAERLARGYNLVVHHDSEKGLAMVANAARTRKLANDAAAQMGAFEAHAYMGQVTANPEKAQAYYQQAAVFLKAAKASPQAKTRPLVAKSIAQSVDYMKYYPELEQVTRK